MITLKQVDELVGHNMGTFYADIYRDLKNKDPRGITFESVEDFQNELNQLLKELIEFQRWMKSYGGDPRHGG